MRAFRRSRLRTRVRCSGEVLRSVRLRLQSERGAARRPCALRARVARASLATGLKVPSRARCRSEVRAARRSNGGKLREREIVIGPAPPKRAERAARVQPIDRAARVLRQFGLVETGEAVDAIASGRTFGIAEFGKEHALAAERLLQLAEERHDVGIEAIARERAVDRIAVHRCERPRPRDARRPQAAILYRNPRRAFRRSRRRRRLRAASRTNARSTRAASCGVAGSRRLENSLPRSHAKSAGWSRNALADALRAEHLRAQKLADRRRSRRWRDRRRVPPAIVRNRPCVVPRSSVHAGSQLTPLMWPQKSVGIACSPAAPIAFHRSHRSAASASASIVVGLRLKGLPHEKEANDVEPKLFDARHVFADLVEIEALPHIHRAAARPIVDAEEKAGHAGGFVRLRPCAAPLGR